MATIQPLADKILAFTDSWSGIPNELIGWVVPLILAGLTIAIMWHGYKIVRGAGGQDHLLDVFFMSMRAFLVFALCLAAGSYAANVVGIATDLRESLSTLFTGTSGSIYGQLDHIVDGTTDAYHKMYLWGIDHIDVGITSSDMSGLAPIIGGGIMTLFVVFFAFVAAVNMLIIDMSLAIVFALGPLFVACLAFQVTASFFNTWVAAVLKYVFTAVVVSAMVSLGMNIVSDYADKFAGIDPSATGAAAPDYIGIAAAAAVALLILIMLTFKAAQIAADMAGGVALQIASLAQAARWTVNPAGAALSAASKVAGAGAGNLAGRAGAAAAKTGVGRAVGSSRAMQYAMSGINTMSSIGGGARAAMGQKSVSGAIRSGYRAGSSASRGTGTITK